MEYIKLNFDFKPPVIQNHVHELHGCLKTAEGNHSHHFFAVSGDALPMVGTEHIHEIYFRTDTVNGHFHEYFGRTLETITIGDRHIHHLEAFTTTNAGHNHGFRLVTFIQDPSGV